jgi:HTH-type transcriptional regulator/antitoxin HipB
METPNQNFILNLGPIVRYHRKKSGLTRVELARLAAVGKTVIFDIEHSKESIQLNTLIKVLTVLNITMDLHSPLMKFVSKQ